ncbi:FecR family protein [Agriterribacter sp.]|uniref:FecR family protein n=1 Tax=Agriterribacter sp. TaxID=2821509 RepID=UPI002CADDF05|nr:FecR domain-containing protein [Agriterribacter sp.]HTN05892.1 FecR domain-containing protein [Agriterribacter sp.]
MNTEQARELLKRYRLGLCSEAEKTTIEAWLASLVESRQWEWAETEKEAFNEMLQMRIREEIDETNTTPAIPQRKFRFFHFAAAAAIIFMVSAGTYTLLFRHEEKKEMLMHKATLQPGNDVQPGENGAILTLANGEKIVLDSAGNGTLAIQSDVKVINRGGQLIYDSKSSSSNEVVYNTISTPRAKQFKLQLSDGTRVWLNAASSIRYPARFTQNSRTVEISGEAYVEVASLQNAAGKAKIPFVVKILSATGNDGGTIKVTGTHFNINAYEDEALIKTTLIEGGIQFKKGNVEKALLPGQQSQLDKKGIIRIADGINVETEIAWKNGYFTYDKTDIQTVMKQLSRWYDIEIEYENGKIPDEKYWGDIQRDAPLSNVLKVLEISGVKFRIEGKKVIVVSGG